MGRVFDTASKCRRFSLYPCIMQLKAAPVSHVEGRPELAWSFIPAYPTSPLPVAVDRKLSSQFFYSGTSDAAHNRVNQRVAGKQSGSLLPYNDILVAEVETVRAHVRRLGRKDVSLVVGEGKEGGGTAKQAGVLFGSMASLFQANVKALLLLMEKANSEAVCLGGPGVMAKTTDAFVKAMTALTMSVQNLHEGGLHRLRYTHTPNKQAAVTTTDTTVPAAPPASKKSRRK